MKALIKTEKPKVKQLIKPEDLTALDKLFNLSESPNSDVKEMALKIVDSVETNGQFLFIPDSLNELMQAIHIICSPANKTTPVINLSKHAS